jgi:hypothetical protein
MRGSSVLVRAGSVATVATLSLGGMAVTATAAMASNGHHHSRLDATRLSISNKVIAHSKHKASDITGVLRDGRTGVAGETVTLESRTGKKPRWAADGSATTGTDGSVSFMVSPTTRTQFRLVFAGDSTYRRSHSNVVTLNVHKK